MSPEIAATPTQAPPAQEQLADEVRQLLGERTIVLVGLMGAGKSSIGKRLGARLGLPFLDVDTEIETAANATIPEIFERFGEAYFRDGERRVLVRLLDNKPKVLATGGGAYMNAESRAAIKAHGVSIWLRADLDVLMARVRRRSNRPLIKGDNPEAVMRRLMEERYPVYAEADIHIDSREVAHEMVMSEILDRLAAYLRGHSNGKSP